MVSTFGGKPGFHVYPVSLTCAIDMGRTIKTGGSRPASRLPFARQQKEEKSA